MVDWSDEERATLTKLFATLDTNAVGEEALARCLVVYPWTMRYFASFGNLYNAEAIMANPQVAAQGRVIVGGLKTALDNLDTMEDAFKELSIKHSTVLRVDPDNFRLISDIIVIIVAKTMGKRFNATMQGTLQKFLAIVCYSLSKQYA